MGRVICIGLGPGDPDLMSVKARRILQEAPLVAYFRKPGRRGMARSIVEGLLAERVEEWAMEYPLTTEISVDDPGYNAALAPFYDDWAARLRDEAARRDVVVLCEGDPLLYGSFMHLQRRLPAELVEIVPGIPGMVGCWNVVGLPMTWGDDVLTVLPATLSEEELAQRLAGSDAVVVMKLGRNLDKLRRALERAGRLDEAWLVEHGTMEGQRIARLAEFPGKAGYFSIALLHGQGRRP